MTKVNNKREWWLEENPIAPGVHVASTVPFEETFACKAIHVVDYESYAKAIEALRFYAEYDELPTWLREGDRPFLRGDKAKETLTELGESLTP